jgi:hypothetical protein
LEKLISHQYWLSHILPLILSPVKKYFLMLLSLFILIDILQATTGALAMEVKALEKKLLTNTVKLITT